MIHSSISSIGLFGDISGASLQILIAADNDPNKGGMLFQVLVVLFLIPRLPCYYHLAKLKGITIGSSVG